MLKLTLPAKPGKEPITKIEVVDIVHFTNTPSDRLYLVCGYSRMIGHWSFCNIDHLVHGCTNSVYTLQGSPTSVDPGVVDEVFDCSLTVTRRTPKV